MNELGNLLPEDEWIWVDCPRLISQEQFDRVAALRASRAPRVTPPHVVAGTTLLVGVDETGQPASLSVLVGRPDGMGANVVVAPVITPLEKDGYAHTEVWIPEGKWTDMFTRDEYKAGSGGKLKVLLRRLESIPVLVRAGGVIVTSGDKGNSIKNPEKR